MQTNGEAAAATLARMRETLADRIKRLRRHKGLTQRELGQLVGVSRTAVTLWERGDTQALKGKNLLQAAQALGVSPSYLETGKEDGELEAGPPVGDYRRAPLVGTAQLGDGGYWHELEYPTGHGDGVVDAPTRDPNAYAIRVRGDSMAPAIRSGWIVVVEPSRDVIPGEYVLVRTSDGRSMVKELLFRRDGEVSLMSVNDEHGRLTLQESEIVIMHYVGFIVPPSKLRIG